MVAAWGVDGHTIAAASKAVELGLADVILVGDQELIAKACSEENVDPSIFTIVHNSGELSSVAANTTTAKNCLPLWKTAIL